MRAAVAGVSVVGVGLIVHFTLAGAGADFLADALYAVMMYLIVVFLAPRLLPITNAAIACGVCALIELSQLTRGPAGLTSVFPPARLVLGTTFAPVDLVAYAGGVAAAFACDSIQLNRRRRRVVLRAPSTLRS